MSEYYDFAADVFWGRAKTGVIDVESFLDAYEKTLEPYLPTIDSLFDETNGLLNRGTYGDIKKAKEKREEERLTNSIPAGKKEKIDYALMGLSKIWTMQFKDGALTLVQQTKKEKQDKAEIAVQKKLARQKEFKDIEPQLQNELTTYVDTWFTDFSNKLKSIYMTLSDCLDKIKSFEYNTFYVGTIEAVLAKHPYAKVNDGYKVDLISHNLDKVPTKSNGDSWELDDYTYYIGYSVTIMVLGQIIKADLPEHILLPTIDVPALQRFIKDKLESNFKFIGDGLANKAKKYVTYYTQASEVSKQIQKAANNHEEAVKDFPVIINKLIFKGTAKADNTSSGTKYSDGSDELDHEMAMQKIVDKLIPCLAYCSWNASIDIGGKKQTISCKAHSDMSTLEDAVSDYVRFNGKDLKVIPNYEVV